MDKFLWNTLFNLIDILFITFSIWAAVRSLKKNEYAWFGFYIASAIFISFLLLKGVFYGALDY